MKKTRISALILSAVLCAGAVVSAAPTAEPTQTPKVTSSASPKSTQKPSSSPKATDKSDKDTKKDDVKKADASGKTEKKTSFPVPHAKSAVVIDANSGDVIYALNADEKMPTAGMSNIMTAIVVLENSSLSDTCVVTDEMLSGITYDQPQLGMKVGEAYTVEQLLHAILINSDNDAANALAISVSGSIDAFVEKMNAKAEELGLSNTHYSNPTGLQDENHYMSAADIATLSVYAMKNSTFAKIVKTPKYIFPPTNQRENEKTLLSTNHLVSRYKYPYHFYAKANGVKSSNSKDAGYCLCASGVNGHMNIISVVMGCDNTDVNEGAYSFTDTIKIFDYIFENYQSVQLAKVGDVLYDSKVKEAKNSTRVALTVDEDIYTTLKNTQDPSLIENEVKLTKPIKAPIKQGDYFGTITYKYNGKEIKTVDLVAANEVKRDFILHIISAVTHFIFNPITLVILLLICYLLIRIRINQNKKRRLRHSKMVAYNKTSKAGQPSDNYKYGSTRNKRYNNKIRK